MSIRRQNLINIMVWLCITIFYCYQYILRVLPNIVMPELMSKFNIGTTEFGSFAGIYYIGYIAIHIPMGLLLSRFGSRKVLPICVLLTASGLAPLIYSNVWNYVLIGRLLTGIGSSAAIIAALQIFRIIYPTHFTRMLGIMVCFGLITVVYSGGPLGRILNMIGIERLANILIIMGVVLTVITFLLLPSMPAVESKNDVWSDVKAIICNYKIVIVSVLAGLMVGPLEGFADAWGSAFFGKIYGIDRASAGAILFSTYSGMCVGSLVLPFIVDKTSGYYSSTLVAGVVMTLCFGYILSGDANAFTLNVTCWIIGIFCAYQVVIIAKIATFVPERLSGMAAAVANMIIMAFGSLFHNAIGATMDKFWDGSISDGVRLYSAEAYINGIAIIPAAIVIAIIGFIIVIITDYKNRKQIG